MLSWLLLWSVISTPPSSCVRESSPSGKPTVSHSKRIEAWFLWYTSSLTTMHDTLGILAVDGAAAVALVRRLVVAASASDRFSVTE
jgi:hypothetical protein